MSDYCKDCAWFLNLSKGAYTYIEGMFCLAPEIMEYRGFSWDYLEHGSYLDRGKFLSSESRVENMDKIRINTSILAFCKLKGLRS